MFCSKRNPTLYIVKHSSSVLMKEFGLQFREDVDLNDQELRKEPAGFTASEQQL